MVFKSRFKILGYKDYEVPSDDKSIVYQGKHLYVSYPEEGVVGSRVDIQKISSRAKNYQTIEVGSTYDVSYESTEYQGETRLKIVGVQKVLDSK